MASGKINLPIVSKFDDRGIRAATSGLGKLGKGLAGVGIAAGAAFVAVGAAGTAFVVASAKQLMEIEKLNAQTNAAIKSTGSAAGRTVDQINELNGSLEKLTGIEAEVIQQGQNMLLTFTNIKGDTFDEATEAALDLSVALGKDMQSAALLVGKALNDPVKGMGALSKAGVQFTEDQKAAIEAMVELNDTAGAQSAILEELNKQFGGSAAAFGETTAGQLAKIANVFGEIGEAVAGPFLSVFKDALPVITDVLEAFVDSPEFASMLQELTESLVKMAPSLEELLPDLVTFALRLIPLIITLIPVLIPLIDGLNETFKFFTDQMERVNELTGDAFVSFTLLLGPVGYLAQAVLGFSKFLEGLGLNLGMVLGPVQALFFFFQDLDGSIRRVMRTFEAFVRLVTGQPTDVISYYDLPSQLRPSMPAQRPMADGGIVMRPTPNLLVGEAGPEAIIPLNRMGSMGGQTVNVTVNTVAGDPVAIERVVLDAISRASRRGTTRLAV